RPPPPRAPRGRRPAHPHLTTSSSGRHAPPRAAPHPFPREASHPAPPGIERRPRMTVPRLFAIAFIVPATTAACVILWTSVVVRTGESDTRLVKEVRQLWGGEHVQQAPEAWTETTRVVVEPSKDGPGGAPTAAAIRTVVDKHPLALRSSRIEASLT